MTQQRTHIDFCPHCGNHTPQLIVYTHSYHDTWYGSDGRALPHEESPASEAILCICGTCNGPLLYNGLEYGERFEWPQLVHPKDGTLHKSVPREIQQIYREAAIIKRNAPNAFAMMIRKGLEAICANRDATGRTLAAKLKSLADRGEIPPALAELTDALRTVGNTAAHDSLQNITAPMTWAIDDLFRAVVEYVYIAPAKLNEFKKSLNTFNGKDN